MEPCYFGTALIGVGGAIIGALVGSWITYRFSINLADIIDRRKANHMFIRTFHKELADVYPTPVNWPEDMNRFLRSKFTILQAAVGEFRYYLPTKEWDCFDDAWFRFYCSTGREVDKQCQCYHHYMPFISTSIVNGKEVTVDNTKTYKDTFKYNVDSLLKFAKKT